MKRLAAVRMLENKLGIQLDQTKEVSGYFVVDGIEVLKFHRTPQHSKTDLSKGAEARLKRDSQLTRTEFLDLVDCRLDRESYLQILRSKGLLP